MNRRLFILAAFAAVIFSCCTEPEDGVKTTFQSSRAWAPIIDNRGDAVMVYGVGGNPSDKEGNSKKFQERVASWREKGYRTDFMTGIAWGGYQDYFTGKWDGKEHLDEGQVRVNGDTIWHGHMVPYIVPSENYLKYFKECILTPVIDCGIEGLYFEEPEFWCWGGYSESFKKEWKEYYGLDWMPQDASPEATYLSSKLKYHLYYRAIEEAGNFAKEYGKSKGLDVKCYIPTHSLLNYAQWHIVSPEASLASLPCIDGYIAQTWTGTSRESNYYNGVRKERVFEAAFLEYGCAESMVAPTGRKVWFLTDPIEDWPRDWEDYRRNYHATFTAQLLYPDINTYEIMPWPERIYGGLYRKAPGSEEKIRIPKDYSTMMQVMTNALQKMPVSKNKVSGSQGISIVMANSLMFQRFPTHEGYEDPQLSNFFGMALPFVKRGVPVGITHLENVGYEKALKDVKVLIMTYSNMKPMDPEAHTYIAEWVKKGGILVYSGKDNDPFQKVMEWWNTGDNEYSAPSDHLFEQLGMPYNVPEGVYSSGKGKVCVLRSDPKDYVLTEGGDAKLIAAVQKLYKGLEFKNSFELQRGPYKLAAVLDENEDKSPLELSGLYIDLYNAELPVYENVTVEPGHQAFLYDVTKAPKAPAILAAASREYDVEKSKKSFSYTAKGPAETINSSRILLPRKPYSVLVNGEEYIGNGSWDEKSSTWLLSFNNNPDGVSVKFAW